MNDRTLFDVDRTTTAQCEACGAIREPDQAKASPCPFEEYDRVYLNTGRRAKRCLNRHDPAHAPFPEGY